jgi:hypothetical protein
MWYAVLPTSLVLTLAYTLITTFRFQISAINGLPRTTPKTEALYMYMCVCMHTCMYVYTYVHGGAVR